MNVFRGLVHNSKHKYKTKMLCYVMGTKCLVVVRQIGIFNVTFSFSFIDHITCNLLNNLLHSRN